MASALTGNKIKDSYQALLKMGTNGSLDPTTLITISDGLGNDTPLQLAGDKLATDYLGNTQGLFLDFLNDDYQFGDINGGTAYLSIGINGSSLYGNDVSSLESTNKQTIFNNGTNQLIYTSNDNGTYSGDRGFKLDFANNIFQFGDYAGVNYFGQLIITNGASELVSDNNNLGLFGPSLNTVLGYFPGSINTNNPGENSNNYVFGSNWLIDNSNAIYPFKYNTVLNCYNNGLDTSDKAMRYNLFVNIQDPGLTLKSNVPLDDNIANCFIFGLTDFLGNNSLQMWTDKQVPTNVIVLNGSALDYKSLSNNIFSVNASNVVIGDESTGIHIIGGDFKDKGDILPSSHIIDPEKKGIVIEGRGALVTNNFVKVKAEKFYQTTPSVVGQVQVQEKQFFMYYPDGSVKQTLLDSLNDPNFYLPNSSSNAVNIKLVSTIGSGDTTDTGNSYIERTYLVLVDSLGVLSYNDYCTGCEKNPNSATELALEKPIPGYFYIDCIPDNTNGNACWVKALVTVNTITI
jgi:hypothetical protein